MSAESFDLMVIGGGPAGYVAAIRGGQLGLKTACVESRGTLGGTCLNVGCIPSKALLQSSEAYIEARDHAAEMGVLTGKVGFDLSVMQARKSKVVSTMTRGIEGLFKKNKVTYIRGTGSFKGPQEVEVQGDEGRKVYHAKHVIIATGSAPIELPFAKFDEKYIVSSTGALAFDKVPKHLVVIGGGVIGLELGSVWARLGAKVTVVEAFDEILPMMDGDVIRTMAKVMKKQGMEILTKTKCKEVSRKGAKLTLKADGPDGELEFGCDRVLVAVGRRAYTEGLNLAAIGLETDRSGKVAIDDHFRTAVKGVYAVGDVVRGPMLAHKAEEEGVACVEQICGVSGHVNYEAIPNVVYTWPEVASVGKTTEQCKEEGLAVNIGKFPFAANGRAKANGFTEGFVKVIADAKTDRLLGVHIVGPHASELIGEVAIGFEYKASAEDLARSVHAHPTLSEAIKEACLGVDKRSINI